MAKDTRGRARNLKKGGKNILHQTGRTNLKPRMPGSTKRPRKKSKPKAILDLSGATSGKLIKPAKDRKATAGKNLTSRPAAYTRKPRVGQVHPGVQPKKIMGKPTPRRKAAAPKGSYKSTKQPAPAVPPPVEPEVDSKAPETPPEEPETEEKPKSEINWAKLIPAVREAINFDEEVYSDALGVSRSTLRRYESGSLTPGAEKREAILDDVRDHTTLDLDDFRE